MKVSRHHLKNVQKKVIKSGSGGEDKMVRPAKDEKVISFKKRPKPSQNKRKTA